MQNPYQDSQIAQKYIDFLHSKNGKIQQKILFKFIEKNLPTDKSITILDAGCGSGWLSNMLKNKNHAVEACDHSEFFINRAKTLYPKINFKIADCGLSLPYALNAFHTIILNMVGPDLPNLNSAFKHLVYSLQKDGQLLMTLPNPHCTFPAAEWKKSWTDLLFNKPPTLQFKAPPKSGTRVLREFKKNQKIDSYFYSLEDYVSSAKQSGLKLTKKIEIRSAQDSQDFDLNYQLFRHPLFLLLKFKKVA